MRGTPSLAFVPSWAAGQLRVSLSARQSSLQPLRCRCSEPSHGSNGGGAVSPLGRHVGVALAAAAVAIAVSWGDAAHAYGLEKGRLEKCRGDIPCVSTTSVGNPSKFGPPWSYQPQTNDPDLAWAALKKAVAENRDKGAIVEAVDGPDEYYLRAEFPSSFKGTDDIEFRLLKKDALVTYRSASREAIFIYPLQAPINTDKNKTRLLDIREALGWEELAGFNVIGT